MKLPLLLVAAGAAMILPAGAQEPAGAAFEPGVVFNAAELLPPDSLRGPSFRVRDPVVTDGYLAHFEIDTDFGLFTAVGVPQVKTRILEAEAIRKLVETSKSDLFAEGLKRSVEKPIDAVKNIVTKPVETAKQLPKSVGHFFGKIGSSIERGVNQVAAGSDNGGTPSAREIGSGVGNAAKGVAGFDKAKLDTAKQLGVDPYSDNVRMQEEMDKVTWAFFAGGLPFRIGAAVVSAGVAVAATNLAGVPADTYALTQSELALRDEQALAAIGVSAEDLKAFMIQPALSTTRRHRIVGALAALPAAAGRGLVIRLANTCATPAQAEILINALEILASRQAAGTADYRSLRGLGRLPAATTAEGELHVPAPVDYVTWTEEVAAFAHRDDLGAAPKVLLHTGRLSEAAAAGLAAAGWKTVALPYPAR